MRAVRAAGFALCRAGARTLGLAAKVFAVTAPGLLSAAELRAAIARSWEDFGNSELHAESGLFEWEREIYPRFLKPDDRVLVVGCGTGRDLIALARLGYRVAGLEVAARAAHTARRHLTRLAFHADVAIGSIESAPLSPCDAVILSWSVFSSIPGRAARIRVLARIRQHVGPAGRVLLNYVVRTDADGETARRLTNAAAVVARTDWRPEPGDAVALTKTGVHFEHRFAPGDVEDEARAAGLDVVFHARREEGVAVLVPASVT